MNFKNTKNLRLALIAVVLGIVGITVAYAALSSTLSVTVSKVTQNIATWNVGFTGSTASASVGGTSSTGRSCGTATINATSVTVADTTLSKPDDSCTYTLTIKNNGTIAAKLSSITPTKPTGTNVTCGTASGATMVCGNITYKLTTDADGTTAVPTNTTLNSNATQTVYLVVKYTGTTLNSSEVTQSNAKFALKYEQE